MFGNRAYTFLSIAVIGLGTLLTDLLFAIQAPLPRFLSSQASLQAAFGVLFLTVVTAWVWFAFIRPPILGKRNFHKYASTLYSYIIRGSETELPQLAAELGRSAYPLVKFARPHWRHDPPGAPELDLSNPGPADYAHDILLLIANRKLCRAIVKEALGTAILFFEAMTHYRKHHLPIGQFASNTSTEAFINKDSMVYHEEDDSDRPHWVHEAV